MVSADVVEIDGIYYNIVSKAKIAEVAQKPSGYYAGNVIVPANIIYNGEEYSVTSIGTYTFGSCTDLTSITIPNSVTNIGEYAFSDCRNLTSVILPNSVTNMGVGVFRGCSSLTSLIIPNKVTSIAQYTFYDCRSLISITIPNNVKDIGDYAFYRCEALTSLTIGNGVTSIGKDAFLWCYRLTSVHISDLAAWCKIAFGSNFMYPYHLYLGEEEIKDLVVPNNVTSIAEYAFHSCSSLTSVIIPNNVTSIGKGAFGGCSSLASVTISNNVTNIAYGTFWGCSGLTSVTIPSSVTNIGEYAFCECSSLPSITIPNSVTSIESCAFKDCVGLKELTIGNGISSIYSKSFESCRELTDVYCLAEDVPSMVKYVRVREGWYETRECTDAFQNSYIEYITLHVPSSSIEQYKVVEPWMSFKEIVAIGKPLYTITYIVDGKIFKTNQLEEGGIITPEAPPTKEGYTFIGWSEIPETMPAHDVTVTSTFTINKYKLTYIVDGEEYKSFEIEYSSTITQEGGPTKDGYNFLGWSEIPEIMPAHDVIVTGNFERCYNIGSVTSLISFILRGNGGNEDIAIYDMNGNGVLDVGDLVLVVRKVLNSTKRSAATRANIDCMTPDLSQYSAAQFVLNVPADVREQDIQLVKSIENTHQMMCKQIEPGAFAVVIYSLTNNMLTSEDGSIIEVNTGETHAGDLSIQDIMFAKPTGETKRFDNMPVVTAISNVKGKTEHRKVYDLKGQKRNRVEGLQKGVYVENGKKIVVR